MFKTSEVKLQRYPTNLIDKDWSQRHIKYYDYGLDFIKKVHEFEVFEDDVWLVTLPKSGTTWMQELLWLVMNNYDFAAAKQEHLEVRTPYFEFDYLVYRNLETAFKTVENLPRPRLIKSHLCLPLLPRQIWDKKPKVVYVARNFKDSFVSHYHHKRNLGFNMDETLEQFIDSYMNGESLFDPILHLTEFYALRNEPWVFYTSYERMKSDLRHVITAICKFLNKTITPEIMEKMLQHLSFEQMKNNSKTNHHWEFERIRKQFGLPCEYTNFVRKGLVDGYKEELSPTMVDKMDRWMTENLSQQHVTMEELVLLK